MKLTVDQAVLLSALVGAIFGLFGGFVKGIKDERGKARAHYTKLINSAMENAYNAGYIDGNTKQAKRPSGQK
jgi:hydrogenase/urease accessory protein HupE